MHSISKRLSILFILCTLATILLVTLFVNFTVTNKFDQYMVDIQNRRYQRIVTYLEDVYKREGEWSVNTGVELMHEAYMGNYCLTLMDDKKQTVWGMNPNEIKNQLNMNEMPTQKNGVYTTKTFAIKVDSKKVGYVDIGQYSSILLTEEDINFKSSINKSIIASGILTLIIIGGFSFYFSKQFSNPIKDVAQLSVNLSKGNFETKSSIKSNLLELEDLQKSVNILAGKLKYQDTLRKRLVSDISHEIRTPLNVLQNNLEAMIDGVYPVTTEKLHALNEEVIRFGKLINSLNVLKHFEAESTKLTYETIYLDEFITEICKGFYLDAEKKNISLQYHVQPNHKYLITGDKDQLKQVFINLVANAIKFTTFEGIVLIKLYENGKNIVVEVCDNGMGIKDEDLPFIFERLYRGEMGRQKIEGKGIGLTIVKSILQLHNAGIDVESKVGIGTKFTIYFNENKKS
ncbi:HAMP domain-containing histidine kinase [Neobacillus sp. MM2021_6]|uniref:sensor histidine kinase n=1 Tax=Bacillaceae TaxID=186817 RepID=UPI00140992EF|nr:MULTISPECIES: HAMP domain-containing sensor histidine kinase [Bacillaceae]MBO0962548.1 HAMP domain-containing histidine kinase [Neobacillus sp. MM2021_6]NHC17108.1 HAMP domain-containing histidine kinase [Bacillus sp. MM2020_4]